MHVDFLRQSMARLNHTHTLRSSCQTLGVGPLAFLWRSLHLLSSWTSDSTVGLGGEAQFRFNFVCFALEYVEYEHTMNSCHFVDLLGIFC